VGLVKWPVRRETAGGRDTASACRTTQLATGQRNQGTLNAAVSGHRNHSYVLRFRKAILFSGAILGVEAGVGGVSVCQLMVARALVVRVSFRFCHGRYLRTSESYMLVR
jgi:hypothetical protein